MTDHEMRVAIAKACGMTKIKLRNHGLGDFLSGECPNLPPNACGSRVRAVPDYLHDLNAMQSAILSIQPAFRRRFQTALSYRSSRTGKMFCELTARDWAEEFIETNASGKWKE